MDIETLLAALQGAGQHYGEEMGGQFAPPAEEEAPMAAEGLPEAAAPADDLPPDVLEELRQILATEVE